MCKGGLRAENARAMETGECHRGIGGSHRQYRPSCVADPKKEEAAAEKNRLRLALEDLPQNAFKLLGIDAIISGFGQLTLLEMRSLLKKWKRRQEKKDKKIKRDGVFSELRRLKA